MGGIIRGWSGYDRMKLCAKMERGDFAVIGRYARRDDFLDSGVRIVYEVASTGIDVAKKDISILVPDAKQTLRAVCITPTPTLSPHQPPFTVTFPIHFVHLQTRCYSITSALKNQAATNDISHPSFLLKRRGFPQISMPPLKTPPSSSPDFTTPLILFPPCRPSKLRPSSVYLLPLRPWL